MRKPEPVPTKSTITPPPPPQPMPARAQVASELRPIQTAPVRQDDSRAEEIAINTRRWTPSSRIHFNVHPGIAEIQRYVHDMGWVAKGNSVITIRSQEVRWTTDNWKTTNVLMSLDVPSPIVNGFFSLPNVPKGTPVKFAILVGLSSHHPSDSAGARDFGSTWLNNDGQDYTQTSF